MSSISDWLELCMEKVKLAAEKTHFEQERAAWAEKCAREEQFKMEQCKKEIQCENFKPKEERKCKTCKHSSWNNPTKAYCIKACIKFSLWEPVEPKVPTCEACRHFSKIFQLCSTDRGSVDTYLARNNEHFCGSSRRWFELDRRKADRRIKS